MKYFKVHIHGMYFGKVTALAKNLSEKFTWSQNTFTGISSTIQYSTFWKSYSKESLLFELYEQLLWR